MAVILGGITLDPNLYLNDVENNPPVYSSTRTLLGGNLVVQTTPNSSGPQMLLEAIGPNPRTGEFTQEQLDSLQTIANAGTAISFTHPRVGTIQVIILGFDIDQLDRNVCSAIPTKAYYGTITLQEV